MRAWLWARRVWVRAGLISPECQQPGFCGVCSSLLSRELSTQRCSHWRPACAHGAVIAPVRRASCLSSQIRDILVLLLLKNSQIPPSGCLTHHQRRVETQSPVWLFLKGHTVVLTPQKLCQCTTYLIPSSVKLVHSVYGNSLNSMNATHGGRRQWHINLSFSNTINLQLRGTMCMAEGARKTMDDSKR